MKIKNLTEKQFEIAANHIALNAWLQDVDVAIVDHEQANKFLYQTQEFLQKGEGFDVHQTWGVDDIPAILKLMEAAQMILEVFKKQGHQHPFFDINQN